MAQPTITMHRNAENALAPEQQLSAVGTPHLLEQLRNVFDIYESRLLDSGESVKTCCELRRARRIFIDGFVRQWVMRCESIDSEFLVGSAANASHTRTFIYLCQADPVLRDIYQQQAADIGRLSAAWTQFVGKPVDPLTCPLAPYTLTRLFFLFLPELHAPVRIRYGLARVFIQQLPAISVMLQKAAFAFWQRVGLAANSMVPHSLPENWAPLETYKTPSIVARSLMSPLAHHEEVAAVADDIARAALAGDMDDVLALVSAHQQTAILPWLAEQLGGGQLPGVACHMLALLAGPLVMASTDEHFVDNAHPARRVLEEWRHWAPGWIALSGEVTPFGVADQCLHFARTLASNLVQAGQQGETGFDLSHWLEILDFLLALRKRSQQEGSVAVASARLSIEVLEVRAEVDALLHNRAGFDALPKVVVEILSEVWTALLMAIHWREGAASDAWLSAIAVANELLSSVQPVVDKATQLQTMQRIPHLLQQLRKGFDAVIVDRQLYSVYLDRLEQVHLAIMQGKPMPEVSAYWPDPVTLPGRDDPFEVGQWLQEDNGACWRVMFSDELCTVLIDTDSAGLVCCGTAALQAQFMDAELWVLPSPPALLSAAVP